MVGQHSWCPYKIKLWLNKVPPSDKISVAMTRGKYLHDVFENFYAGVNWEMVDDADGEMQQYFEEICEPLTDPDLTDGKQDIKNFCKWNVDRTGQGLDEFFPQMIEQKIYLPDEDIVGVIDRVDINDGKLRVIDYKSGLGNPGDMGKYRFELSMYAHLIEQAHDIEVDEWGIYFSAHNKLLVEPVDEKYWDRWAVKKISKLRHAIETDDLPRTERTFACDRCEYFSHCWR